MLFKISSFVAAAAGTTFRGPKLPLAERASIIQPNDESTLDTEERRRKKENDSRWSGGSERKEIEVERSQIATRATLESVGEKTQDA